jgi:hypothetical protein
MVLKRFRLVAAIAVAAFALTGPIFASDDAPAVNKKVVKKSTYGSPETHALIYGLVATPKKFGKDPKVVGMEFFQMNPAMEPMIVSPGRDGKVFFLQPVPIGSLMFLRSYQFGESNKFYFVTMRVNEGAINVDVKAPGLLYVGSYVNGSAKKVLGYREDITLDRDTEEKEGTELDALKAIRSSFRKTAWEELIEKRIQELDK